MSLLLRPIKAQDATVLDSWFGKQSPYRKAESYWKKLLDVQASKERDIVVAEYEGQPVGYCTLKYKSAYPPFHDANIPEINDLLVAPPFRQKGIARAIVERLEQIAQEKGYKQVGLCVGLYADYGTAQRLYVKMGYIPDGQGAYYDNKPCTPGQTYKLDDDLLIGLIKEL